MARKKQACCREGTALRYGKSYRILMQSIARQTISETITFLFAF
jgi:hypothetical protein